MMRTFSRTLLVTSVLFSIALTSTDPLAAFVQEETPATDVDADTQIADGESSDPAGETELTEAEMDLLAAVSESRDVYMGDMFPIESEQRLEAGMIWNRINQYRELDRRLSKIEETSLTQLRSEIQQIQSRLDALKKLEDVMTDMNPDAVEKAIIEAAENKTKFEKELQAWQKTSAESKTDLQRLYAENNAPFAEQFEILFRPEIEGEFGKLKRTHLNANYVASQVSSRYDREGLSASVSIIMTGTQRLQHTLKQKHVIERGKFNERYPITNQSARNMSVVAGDFQIHIHAHVKNGEKEPDVADMLSKVLDLELLEKLLGELKPLDLEQ